MMLLLRCPALASVCAYTLRTVILLCLMGSAEWNRQRRRGLGGLIPALSCPEERLSAKADYDQRGGGVGRMTQSSLIMTLRKLSADPEHQTDTCGPRHTHTQIWTLQIERFLIAVEQRD